MFVISAEVGRLFFWMLRDIDYNGSFRILSYGLRVLFVLGPTPVSIMAVIAIVIYWHETVKRKSIKVTQFLDKAKIPFFLIFALFEVLFIGYCILINFYFVETLEIILYVVLFLGLLFIGPYSIYVIYISYQFTKKHNRQQILIPLSFIIILLFASSIGAPVLLLVGTPTSYLASYIFSLVMQLIMSTTEFIILFPKSLFKSSSDHSKNKKSNTKRTT